MVQSLEKDLLRISFLHRRSKLLRDPRERPQTRKYQERFFLFRVSKRDKLMKIILNIFGK